MRTLIAWAGDDPDREGLVDTPRRVVKAYEESVRRLPRRTPPRAWRGCSDEVSGYKDLVLVRDIPFVSHCEHHIAPFFGKAHIGYYPTDGVVGLSKLARIVDTFARRLQTQEALSAQIVEAIEDVARHARRRGDDRGRAHLHVDARRAQGRRLDGDDAVHRRIPRRSERADALFQSAARRALTMAVPRPGGVLDRKKDSRLPAEIRRRTDWRPALRSTPASGDVLMVAHMNAEALEATLATGVVHYWSRSRGSPVAQGRHVRPDPDAGRNAGRLRPGRVARPGRGRRRRRRLPHRPAILLLPARRGRRALATRLAVIDRSKLARSLTVAGRRALPCEIM